MNSLTDLSLNFNNKVKFNFAGGNLSSDCGLLLVKDFIHKLGLDKIIKDCFHTSGNDRIRIHHDAENLMQNIYQAIAGYHEDDCADDLKTDPVMNTILGKPALASQPTLSRFYNRLDNENIKQIEAIMEQARHIVYGIEPPKYVVLDIDSTLCGTSGAQEGACFNFHYQDNGYHPLLCYDGLTGDLLKAELRKGSAYSCTGVVEFLEPLLKDFKTNYPKTTLLVRGDSGFATPELYELCEKYGALYTIRLKKNAVLDNILKEQGILDKFDRFYEQDPEHNTEFHTEIKYKAKSWTTERRVAVKIEHKSDELFHFETYVVTNFTDTGSKSIIATYCNRGTMENFIKECKSGFGFDNVSSHTMEVNANRMLIRALAYNIINWMKRLVFTAEYAKSQIETIRTKFIKVAGRIVKSGRYITFKLCSSCPYQSFFEQTLKNITHLNL